jgi:ABC-type glycerol-3-phosphate transport system substrate-binding protein
MVIFYNKTWAEELGFDAPPRTPEEFKQQACVASVKNGDGTGGWFINTSPASVLSWVYAFGGEIATIEGDYDFNTPETSPAFEFLYDLKDTGCAWQPGTLYPNDDFAARRGLFYTSSVVGIPFQQDAFEIAGNEDEWIPIPFPGVGGTSVLTVYGPSYVMLPSTPEEQLAAWLFIKYVFESANQALLVGADGSFPICRSTVPLVVESDAVSSQWLAAVELLDFGKFEPRYQSWSKVRAALQDAAGILYTFNFDSDNMADLLEQLQATVEELHALGGGN